MGTQQTAIETGRATTSVHSPSESSGRMLSLDVFRGGTIAAMILVNNPGNWSAVYEPFLHADWHGWTFTDLVFPFFLWIVGVSITLSFAKRVARGDDRGRLLMHVVRRSALIFLIGLFLSGFPRFNLETIRIPGVLQRIAVCYLIAATIFLFSKTRGRIIWTAGFLGAYWILMKYVPVPGYGTGSFEVPGNFSWYVDNLFLQGHMWRETKTWDPEGIVSTLPAISTALFGILTGQLLQTKKSAHEKAAWLFFMGNLLLFAGMMLATWMPINKKIWTSSYSVFMAGMAAVVFACCYWLVDVLNWRRFAQPFAIYGMNALAVFVLSGLFSKVTSIFKPAVYEEIFVPLGPEKLASLLFAVANVLLFYGVAYVMYRRKWFVRL